jgi:hypothetical protein
MTKKFYTDKDIEELFHSGIKSLQVDDDVVLTDIAYEKAKRLGFNLVTDNSDAPPAAPVRPYLSEMKPPRVQGRLDSVFQASSSPATSPAVGGTDVEKRIRSAVIARLGNQVDATLLDNIIHRVVRATGLK